MKERIMFEHSITTLNIPYAQKVLEHLLAHPEEHDQDFYGRKTACGTSACIAGIAVLMDPETTVVWDFHGEIDEIDEEVIVDGKSENIDHRAADLLGLDDNGVNELFYEYNNQRALMLLKQLIVEAEVAQAFKTE